jgi:hypothetical protein
VACPHTVFNWVKQSVRKGAGVALCRDLLMYWKPAVNSQYLALHFKNNNSMVALASML